VGSESESAGLVVTNDVKIHEAALSLTHWTEWEKISTYMSQEKACKSFAHAQTGALR
jgi:hypothetical protein